jgi:glycosyltransferase involved in cell wall biosynthesis
VVLFGTDANSLINFRKQLIEEMVRRGHEVHAVAAHIPDATAAHLRSLGAEPVSIALGRTSLNPLEAMRAGGAVRRLFERIRPDVVIAYTIKPILLGAPAAHAAGVKRFVALVTGLGYAFTGGREWKRLLSRASATVLYRRAFARTSIAVFQNEDDRRDFGRLRVLPAKVPTGLINGSGVDTQWFSPVPPPAAPSFLMMGRLVTDKGVREFSTAARRLKKRHPELRISIAGWIDPAPHAISQAELQEMIDGGIEYLGPLGDVRPAMAEHSVYVLPSYREGTPRSVLEAMAIGRAIITADVPGCRQTVVHGENGLLVPARDADALYRAMEHLVEHPHLLAPMGEASRRIALEKYEVHQVNRALLRHAGL